MKTTTAWNVIVCLNKIFAVNGFPKFHVNYNGPPWKSDLIKRYFKSRGIKHQRITPLWPRANGLTERFMQSIGKCIKTAIMENKN